MTKKENIILDKSFEFAVRIVNCCRFIRTNHKEFILTDQLLRSGTAVGALVREAEHAQSRKDLKHILIAIVKTSKAT